MRVLIISNEYKLPGGEAEAVSNEVAMLSSHGHQVRSLLFSNRDLGTWRSKLTTAWRASYSRASKARIASELAAYRPELTHVHNFFPLVTPSVYDACREAGVPVVQTLHNYRLLCPGALLLRRGEICEECVNASAYRSLAHRCYRNSWLGTLAVARLVDRHRRSGTWREKVDRFIVLTEFAKAKFVEGGLPAEKMTVKPNFLMPDPGQGRADGGYALYAGRLSVEKGLDVLLRAWESLGRRVPLQIAGGGPLARQVEQASRHLPGVRYVGFQPKDEVLSLMRGAAFLVLPSICYEGLPMALVESLATGLPVVGSNVGSLATLIQDRRTGLHFRPNDPADLAAKVEWLLSHPEQAVRLRKAARAEYLEQYTEERNYRLLLAIYERTLAEASGPVKR